MKKENFEKSFDSLDHGIIEELYKESGDPRPAQRTRFNYRRTLAIAASVALVAASAVAGAQLLRPADTVPSESGTQPSAESSMQNSYVEESAEESYFHEISEESSEILAPEPSAYAWQVFDNVIYQTSEIGRSENNVYGLNSETRVSVNGVYMTDTLYDVLNTAQRFENTTQKFEIAVNFVPRLSAEQLKWEDVRIPINEFVWNGQTYDEIRKAQQKASNICNALEYLLDLASLGYGPEDNYYKITDNDVLDALDPEYLESMIEITDEGYLLDYFKIKAEYESYTSIWSELGAAADEARNAYYEQYPNTAPVIPEDWIKYWENVLDESGIEYTVIQMGFFLVVPCEEFDRIASIVSVKSNMEGFTFDALFGLTLRDMNDNGTNNRNYDPERIN
ncbi:MAG: hypothetical protein J6U75_00550 [Clostridia bacterium]|nr:hypothetical protein [Clostridia bacterium]